MFKQKLRRLPVLGSVYAIIAALGLVVLAVGVIGVAAVYTTNKHVRELEEVANRAFFAEHANTLVYAMVRIRAASTCRRTPPTGPPTAPAS